MSFLPSSVLHDALGDLRVVSYVELVNPVLSRCPCI